jgi:hypothetical protein
MGVELEVVSEGGAGGAGSISAKGGRDLDDDVIDSSYGALSSGNPSGFGDNVGVPSNNSDSNFPYLRPAN